MTPWVCDRSPGVRRAASKGLIAAAFYHLNGDIDIHGTLIVGSGFGAIVSGAVISGGSG